MENQVSKSGIIVAFHVGRGGRFNNPSHRTFIGEKTFQDIIDMANQADQLFYYDRDERGRFCKPYYTDCNGNIMVAAEDMDALTGGIDFDGEYDSDYAYAIEDIGYEDTFRVILSSEWKSYELEQWLREWLKDGIAHNDGEICTFVGDHPRRLEESGYLTHSELVAGDFIDEDEDED